MRLALAACLAAAMLRPALAADVTHQPFQDGKGALIVVSGPFEQGDDRKLTRALLETDGTAVVLFESPGGSLLAGLAMGRAIRIQGAATAVEEGTTCASACGLAWLGGVRRLMGVGAQVGFHAAYYVDDQGRQIETGQGNALIGAYLNQLGLSERAVLYITGAAPADMTWLTFEDAEDLGIPVRQLGQTGTPAPAPAPRQTTQTVPAPSPAPAAPAAQGFQVVHNAPAGYMNIRSGPGTNHPVLFTFPPALPVTVDNCRMADPGGGANQWCLISAQGRVGWISRIGLEPLGTTEVPETLPGNWQVVHSAPAGYMNVRAGPGTGHDILFTLAPMLPVSVERCRPTDMPGGTSVWCLVAAQGQSGWISRSGLEPAGTRPQVAANPGAAVALWRVPAEVSGGYANVRSGPGTMHGVLFTIPAGAAGLQLERCRPPDPGGGRFDWCLVVWQGRSGWLSRNALVPQG